MLRRFCILNLSNSKRLRFLPDICNADIQKTSFSAKTYTVLNGVLNGLQRESWSFGKNYPLSVLTIVYNSPLLSLFASQAGPCLACVAGVKRGRGRGNLGAQAWGRKERNACKDAIVFSVFHAQILKKKTIKPPGTYFNDKLLPSCRSSKFSSSFPATSVLLCVPLDPNRPDRNSKSAWRQSVLIFLRQTPHWKLQRAATFLIE